VPAGPGVHLCQERDVASLGDALVEAIERRQACSRAHVVAHHEIGASIERLEQLYDSLASMAGAEAAAK
jgi:glycosyltransferase involved in cell wall biosynthesis